MVLSFGEGSHLGSPKHLLQRCRFSGGLALPNILAYYWAAHIHKLCYWVKSSESSWCKSGVDWFTLHARFQHLFFFHPLISFTLQYSRGQHCTFKLDASCIGCGRQARRRRSRAGGRSGVGGKDGGKKLCKTWLQVKKRKEKGGAEKAREKKLRALDAEASKCHR